MKRLRPVSTIILKPVKSVLIFTSEYIGSANKIGSHYLAEEFAKLGIATFVVSFPISPLYRFMGKKTDFLARNALTKGWTEVIDNLFVHIPSVVLPPLPAMVKHIPGLLSHWEKQSSQLTCLLCSRSFDVVLTESLFYNTVLQELDYRSLVVRLPDNLRGFWQGNATLLRAEEALLEKADLVVSPSVQLLSNISNETLFLPNGVDIDEYADQLPLPTHYKNLSQSNRAVYVGAIQKWFDHALLKEVARRKPNWSFTIIGKKPAREIVEQYPVNVSFIGEKKGKCKIAFLQHAQAGLIPFETRHNHALINTVNPIKLYEYLAAGIDVISTSWDELRRIDAPILYANNVTEFAAALTQLEKKPLPRKDKKTFASGYSWRTIARDFLSNLPYGSL